MQLIPEDKQIYVSGRIWHEVHPKVDPGIFLRILYESIDLSKYGDGIQKFYFTFIVMNPDDFFKPAKLYSRKKRAADISVQIPYAQVVNATQEKTFKLMEAAYLDGIDKLATLRLNGTFDVAAFKKDVAAIFAKDKWYELNGLEV